MLTDTEVRKLATPERPRKLFDSGGLYLYATPAGGRIWRLKYRFDGKEKLLVLGHYPRVSLKRARATGRGSGEPLPREGPFDHAR